MYYYDSFVIIKIINYNYYHELIIYLINYQ